MHHGFPPIVHDLAVAGSVEADGVRGGLHVDSWSIRKHRSQAGRRVYLQRKTCSRKIRWEKNITLGEPPGFLHSCVFWDLYCAAPERRDTCDHSSEAKAFHDYVSDACLIHPSLAHSGIRDLLFHHVVKPLKCSSVV
ncbi:Single-stranded DNA-binding protein 3 [Anabarilius grahami]|uniref:Single-stranded DNA-binding protein 3 n=1 Tax=Anabarilius grahami TaxID=495550 RepID=A0A3N0XQ58_ANAGA|nr:Single-stranded DNA-binding protein 3 [Anabarilius grahami]